MSKEDIIAMAREANPEHDLTAMLMTCKARVPECGEFAAIAQDLDWLCESFGIKGGQHGTE